jgi:hypothetical protein
MRSALAMFFVLSGASPCLLAVTPEECVKRYHEIAYESGLTATLKLIHPDDLKEFRRLAERFHAQAKAGPAPQGFAKMAENTPDPASLSDLEWCARFMPGFAEMQAPILDLKKNAKMEIVGSVSSGEFHYVVVRWRMAMLGTEIVKLAVVPTRMHAGEPMMLLPEEIMQGARLMAAQR